MAVSEPHEKAVVSAWNVIATPYHDRYRIPTDRIHLGPMVPSPAELGVEIPVKGRRVLDYGCGGGHNAIACARLGAGRVVAVDPSEGQLAVASRLVAQAEVGVDLRRLDERGIDDLPTDFDLVLSVYALHFVEDVKGTLRRLASRLRAGGTLVLSVDHPLRVSGEWGEPGFVVEDYFAHGWQSWPYDFPEAGLRVQLHRYRRTVGDWVAAVLAAPLVLRRLLEPLPPERADDFGLRSKYGAGDPRNVFTRQRLEKVPGSLVIVAERTS